MGGTRLSDLDTGPGTGGLLKRKHQLDMENIIQEIIDGAPVRDILVRVTPGGGKSSLPIIAGRLITAGLADAICWICPRMSLQDQAERNFLDPFFRAMFDHSLLIRSSTNEYNPCRDTRGFVTTYQAIGVDEKETVLSEIRSKRYILILDEYHHAEAEDGSWTKALLPLYNAAKYRILMTGTMERGDGKKIAFTQYHGMMPILQDDEHTRIIEYTRRDALADRAIIPLKFMFHDGMATWEKPSGKEVRSKISTDDPKRANYALYTALKTEYALELLHTTVKDWRDHVTFKNQNAKLLVVTAGIESAKKYTAFLAGQGLNARIATSDDTPDAVGQIKAFKRGKVDILVTCQMAYEGLDAPSISHIACLTNIRSAPWIEQMVARAVRIDPHAGPYEGQEAYIFAPDDQFFKEITAKIEADQITPAFAVKNGNYILGKPTGENGELFEGTKGAPGGIIPLSSQLLGYRELMPSSSMAIVTVSEQEGDVLGQLESHIRRYAFNNRFNPKRLNSEVYQYFMKARRDMTLKELRGCLNHVKRVYPISYIRGTGRTRVPTKAQPFDCTWKDEN
jgi:superfamily II DNA or RNA helicase